MTTPIGKEIRRLRQAKRLSLDDLQRTSGVSRDTLSRIELGKRSPHYSTLRAIARGLDLRAGDVADPRLIEAIGDQGSIATEGDGDRPEDRLRDLIAYITRLDAKTKADFINAVTAVLALARQPDAAESRDATPQHGR